MRIPADGLSCLYRFERWFRSAGPRLLNTSLPEEFRVGDYRVLPAANELYREGAKVQLEPKVMSLLLYLAEHAGRTVSRDQLFSALWPGVVVTDDTLTQAVTKLRKALDDRASEARYIQTVPKRGYRLQAPVSLDAGGDAVSATKLARPTLYLTLLLTLLLTSALSAYFLIVEAPAGVVSPGGGDEAAVDGLPTLTVVPFELLGDDDSQRYLAQGLTHDLITDLSKLSGLWVVGSRSIMGQNPGGQTAATVRYRVLGEVQRVDDQLRVHVHLVDARNGHRLWSERYHRSFENLFRIQEAISRQIASTLSLKVSEAEHLRMARRYTRNVQAYDYFLQAQARLLVRQKDENAASRRLYRQAISLDPSFARAYAGLALSFAAEYRNQWVDDGRSALEQARRMARTALQIDPEIPEVYWVLAYVNAQQREHARALGLLRRAISLDQSFADAYALMGGINTYMGNPAETPGLVRTAIRLNPQAGYLYFLLLGRAYFYLGDWEQAQINLNEALDRNTANLEAHIYLAATEAAAGDHEGAAWEVQEIQALQADFDIGTWLQTYPMTDAGQAQQLVAMLERQDPAR